MARRRRRSGTLGRTGCTEYVVRRRKKGGRILPSSEWKIITRCEKPKDASAPRRPGPRHPVCRRGGADWRSKMRQQLAAGRTPTAQLFTPCR